MESPKNPPNPKKKAATEPVWPCDGLYGAAETGIDRSLPEHFRHNLSYQPVP
jgi:hypothetical protein